MAFKKAKNEQAAVKVLLYGSQGAGKTLTALDIADGLAKKTGGRVAMIATERGYDFYTDASKTRALHPEAFDFDVDPTKSFIDAMRDVDEFIASKKHSVLIVDSLTQVYEACKKLYGEKNKAGSIKIHKWNNINEQYNLFIEKITSCDKHVILCGRSANLYEQSGGKEDVIKIGTQPRVGKDTGHEAHTVIRMEQRMRDGQFEIFAVVEKDRTSLINGQTIKWPSFKNTIAKTLSAFGKVNMGLKSNPKMDVERAEEIERKDRERSKVIFNRLSEMIDCAEKMEDLEDVKLQVRENINSITNEDLDRLREIRDKKEVEIAGEKTGSEKAMEKINGSPM